VLDGLGVELKTATMEGLSQNFIDPTFPVVSDVMHNPWPDINDRGRYANDGVRFSIGYGTAKKS